MPSSSWLTSCRSRVCRLPARGRPNSFRPRVESLEERAVPAVFTVTNTLDSGLGSLRQAIFDANAAFNGSGVPDRIEFNISGTGLRTIQSLDVLPTITDPVVIDGYTQPGSSRNTLVAGDDAVLTIELDCSLVPVAANASTGVLHIAAGNSTVTGLVMNRLPGLGMNGIQIDGGGGNHIDGNFIGTDASGTAIPLAPGQTTPNLAAPSAGNPYGIHIENSTGNWVGLKSAPGDTPDLGERNVISGINWGVAIANGGNNAIAGNFIGTDRTGTGSLGNFVGVGTAGVDDRIGTDGDGRFDVWERNVISGNRYGVALVGSDKSAGPQGTVVSGNSLGTNVTGPLPLGNVGAGVGVINSSRDAMIGGLSPVTANVIAFNSGGGVLIANYSGTPTGISVIGNAIFQNAGLGIDLINTGLPFPDGVTLNDAAGHSGGNNLQNFPVLGAAETINSGLLVSGVLNSTSNTTFRVDLYASPTADASGYGQGRYYLGGTFLKTDQSGNVSFAVDFSAAQVPGGAIPQGWSISATATDSDGNTSEFSQDVTAAASAEQLTQAIAATLQTAIDANTPSIPPIQATPATAAAVVSAIQGLTVPEDQTVSVYLNLSAGTYDHTDVQVPTGMTLYINGSPGTTIDPDSPAFTLLSGNVVISNVTLVVTGDAPTILVAGGSLTLRTSIVQESTGFNQAAILVTAGFVDLGTAADPGRNTFNINGAGAFALNSTATPIAAVGDTFNVNGLPLTPSSLSGTVFADFNDDGQIDFGEKGIAGVTVTLTGTDDLGDAVSQSQMTDADGAYVFPSLRPGRYRITETQPAAYFSGVDTVGTAGGSLATIDQFFVQLDKGVDGLNYNFGEQPPATGSVKKGQSAGIGFWNNKNGQALILSLNAGTGHQLGDWLAATMPNTFGASAGSNNLTGKSNAFVAALFQKDFLMKGVKLDAQVLATALSVYATNATLDSSTAATRYGFIVSGTGLGTDTINLGSNGDAFGVANNTSMSVLALLQAADDQAVLGVLYNGNATKRNEANSLFSALNEAGGI
jgi:hypothetical protein